MMRSRGRHLSVSARELAERFICRRQGRQLTHRAECDVTESSRIRSADRPTPAFDLDLFMALNEEYASKPLVPAPPRKDAESLTDQAVRRANTIAGRVDLQGARVLEVGCGRGHLGPVLAHRHGAQYVGVDIVEYETWSEDRPAVRTICRDISAEAAEDLGEFDVVVSIAVLEHVVHPHSMLEAMYERLRPGGVAYLAANLYRGPKASHRYRQVYFPWPHLLFGDDVWREFYRSVHNRDETFSWVNKLTYAQYLMYFDMIGFRKRKVWLTSSTFDADVYERFADVLSRYPCFDLSHDFVYAVLERPEAPLADPEIQRQRLRADLERLEGELTGIRTSTSWRLTAPLRAARRRFGR
jgi:2-polyprenyl-3-methyl-5-hydroxy-6-metoxy-1,4-benzoquinol methylase